MINMFGPNIKDPKKIQQMMKKLNMNVREVYADEVVIKSEGKETIISNPQIMIVEMSGKDVFQITGDVSERSSANEKDIKMIMEKTGKDKETVVQKLKELDNDLARAIMELSEEKG